MARADSQQATGRVPRGKGARSWVHRPLSRLEYLALGVVLSAVKVVADFGVARYFGRPYSLLFYVSPIDAPLFHMSADRAYWQALALATMPFLLVGVALTVRRLNDAVLSPWFVVLFFVPFANLLFFVTMALVPSRPRPLPVELPQEAPYREAGAPMAAPPLPPMRRYPRTLAAVFGTVVLLGAMAISVGLLRDYGVALMLGAPMISGFATGAFYARLDPRAPYRGAAVATTAVVVLSMALTIVTALEGLGCFVMFLPLLCVPIYLGSFIGFAAAGALPERRVEAPIVIAMMLFFVVLGIERISPLPALSPAPVETSIEIDAPAARVWSLLPSMAEMPPPDDWAFRRGGIAYPVRATLAGEGVGAKRTCDFTTGPALETVDVWQPGRLLGFTIDAQPDPMRELTLYDTVRQPHLDGYVRNLRGELAVEDLGGGRTRLTGRSWYEVRIAPETYWRLFCDLFIHKIHRRVLDVVKARAEEAGPHLYASAGVGR
jgi:uncharacterized membrane protein YhaH (DUF805 family)